MSARAPQKPAAGFALVEAIASLVIMGMVGLMIVQGLGAGRRVWERIDTREAAGETLDSAQTMLRDRVEQIYPATLFERSPPFVDFDGQSQRLAFLANPPQSERPAPLRRYTLGLNTKGQLVLASVSDVAPPGRCPRFRCCCRMSAASTCPISGRVIRTNCGAGVASGARSWPCLSWCACAWSSSRATRAGGQTSSSIHK